VMRYMSTLVSLSLDLYRAYTYDLKGIVYPVLYCLTWKTSCIDAFSSYSCYT